MSSDRTVPCHDHQLRPAGTAIRDTMALQNKGHVQNSDRGARTVDVARLKRQHPIAGVITATGVSLRRSGTRQVGRCPFHDDSHPSFVVYPDTESFYCFGCRTGGDVITFLRRREGLSFLDAVARLEGSCSPSAAAAPERLSLDDRMVLTAACAVYHETLLGNRDALAYLAGRGVPMHVIRRCRLGYSDGRTLRPYLERRRLGVRRATELGLLWPSGGGETLTGRIVVPELRGGQCLWMLGRALTDGHQPKYWGLPLPKPILGYERVQGRSWVVVVEGAFDYLTGVAWGLPVCALLGTHVRAERLAFLERTERVALVFDSDDPGRQAATALAGRLGPRAAMVTLPPGLKDLSDLQQRPDGRRVFARILAELGFPTHLPTQQGTWDAQEARDVASQA
jgi:DNA primase